MASSIASRWTFLDRLIERLRFGAVTHLIKEGAIVADLGCGTGAFLRYIAGKITSGYGIDRGIEDRVEGNIFFRSGDLDVSIPLPDSSVDTVTALAVIEHLDVPSRFAEEIRRILKPGGVCILSTPPPRSKLLLELLSWFRLISRKDIMDHKCYFQREDLIRLFKGFESIKTKSFFLGMNMLLVAER